MSRVQGGDQLGVGLHDTVGGRPELTDRRRPGPEALAEAGTSLSPDPRD